MTDGGPAANPDEKNPSPSQANRYEAVTENLHSARHPRVRSFYGAIMEAMRQSWTDDRLDDFRAETARRFETVDQRFDRLERRVDDGFGELRREMNDRFGQVDKRFEVMQDRLEAMHRMLFRFCVLALSALLGTLATMAGTLITVVTQL